jgi:hypothetical protein
MNVGMSLYDVPKNEATVPDHLAVFANGLHWSRWQLT